MISLKSSKEAQKLISKNMREQRLEKGLTQTGLSNRSGVSLATLRKFEQKGTISLESFLKLTLSLGSIENIIQATKLSSTGFTSIDDVLKSSSIKKPKRGWHK